MPAPNEPSYSRLRSNLARLTFELNFLNLRLKAGFDPGQPRVPAGNADGGQWARVGAAAGSGAGSGTARTAASNAGAAASGNGSPEERVFVDDTGRQTWRTYVERYRPDGSLESRTILNRDGSRITSEFGPAGADGAYQRNTVTLADGSRFIFENNGATQRIYDRDGKLISEAVWTPDGPVSQPIVQQVFADPRRQAAEKLIQAGVVLYSWWMSGREPSEGTIFAFNAGAYRRADVAGEPPLFVGKLTEEEVEEACKRFPEVQNTTDSVATSLMRSDYSTSSAYGTAVHKGVQDEINGLGDPNFIAEMSIKKTTDEILAAEIVRYGARRSIRIDVFERQSQELVCVYDIKTGVSGLSVARAIDIISHVFALYSTTKWVYIIEVRPSL